MKVKQHRRPHTRIDSTVPCPYCGLQMRTSLIDRHMVVCLSVPEVYARTRALLADAAGFIVSIPQYDAACCGRPDVPGRVSLYRRFKTWANVAAAFGLQYAGDTDRRATKADRRAMEIGAELDAEIAADRAASAEPATPEGLPVASVSAHRSVIACNDRGQAFTVCRTETRYMLR